MQEKQNISVSEIGWTLVLPITGGALLGRFLDRVFNSSPKITLFLILSGLIVSVSYFYILARKLNEKQ